MQALNRTLINKISKMNRILSAFIMGLVARDAGRPRVGIRFMPNNKMMMRKK